MALIPKTDIQEFWELHGRVEALKVYINHTAYPDKDVMLEMLGDPLEKGEIPFEE